MEIREVQFDVTHSQLAELVNLANITRFAQPTITRQAYQPLSITRRLHSQPQQYI